MNSNSTVILNHLMKSSITQLEAMRTYGISRLAARIHNLRSDGYRIKTFIIDGKNRRGARCRFAKYVLIR